MGQKYMFGTILVKTGLVVWNSQPTDTQAYIYNHNAGLKKTFLFRGPKNVQLQLITEFVVRLLCFRKNTVDEFS